MRVNINILYNTLYCEKCRITEIEYLFNNGSFFKIKLYSDQAHDKRMTNVSLVFSCD